MSAFNKNLKIQQAIKEGKPIPADEELSIQNNGGPKLSRHERQQANRAKFLVDKEQQLTDHMMENDQDPIEDEISNQENISKENSGIAQAPLEPIAEEDEESPKTQVANNIF